MLCLENVEYPCGFRKLLLSITLLNLFNYQTDTKEKDLYSCPIHGKNCKK